MQTPEEFYEAAEERTSLRKQGERYHDLREAMGRLHRYYDVHTAKAITPASVARRIQWSMDEVSDDERDES